MTTDISNEKTTIQLDKLALLENLLFVADGPVLPKQLAKALDIKTRQAKTLLRELESKIKLRGLSLQRTERGVQLTTAAAAGAVIERFLGLKHSTRLSSAALEVLSIVAYLQPATRPSVDQIRGVNSDGSLRSLLSRGLIAEVGRQESPGRPILYGTTPEFLQQFGLSSLQALPPLEQQLPETTEQNA